jgi:hypothetical protein
VSWSLVIGKPKECLHVRADYLLLTVIKGAS